MYVSVSQMCACKASQHPNRSIQTNQDKRTRRPSVRHGHDSNGAGVKLLVLLPMCVDAISCWFWGGGTRRTGVNDMNVCASDGTNVDGCVPRPLAAASSYRNRPHRIDRSTQSNCGRRPVPGVWIDEEVAMRGYVPMCRTAERKTKPCGLLETLAMGWAGCCRPARALFLVRALLLLARRRPPCFWTRRIIKSCPGIQSNQTPLGSSSTD